MILSPNPFAPKFAFLGIFQQTIDLSPLLKPSVSLRPLRQKIPMTTPLNYLDFTKVDMRVGRITAVKDFPQARKPAYQLTIDFGPLGIRRSSAQVTNYTKDELLNRLIVAVVNFPPKQIGPFRSEVLVLGAINADDTVILLKPDDLAELGAPIA